MKNVVDDLSERGLIADSTNTHELREHLSEPRTFYVGFDPTAPSLHVGSLLMLTTARRLQKAGHRAIILVGGATGLIGDPRDIGERVLNDPSVVETWRHRIHEQVVPFFDMEGSNPARIVNNLDWFASRSATDFLLDVGSHFPLTKMLSRQVVRSRIEDGISFTEFSYVLLQANDFWELNQRYGCTLQFGGSDQWGNISAGIEYSRRRSNVQVHGFTTPLVTNNQGRKFGKSEGGAVWLDGSLTSPTEFHAFWMATSDDDARRYLTLFSEFSLEEISEVANPRQVLADQMTRLTHPGAS